MGNEAEWRFQLRAPDTLRRQLSDAAEADGRSVNKEIIFLLNVALEQRRYWHRAQDTS